MTWQFQITSTILDAADMSAQRISIHVNFGGIWNYMDINNCSI